jgi:hypothetical protein
LVLSCSWVPVGSRFGRRPSAVGGRRRHQCAVGAVDAAEVSVEVVDPATKEGGHLLGIVTHGRELDLVLPRFRTCLLTNRVGGRSCLGASRSHA